jgi:hypothetical protein
MSSTSLFSSPLFIGGFACTCAFFALILIGGLGFVLMQKKKKEGESTDTPQLEPASTQEEIGAPSATLPEPSTLSPSTSPDVLKGPEPVRTPMVEPVPMPQLHSGVPDPSAIPGLDAPIVAADTLDDDEAETPTVIMPRDEDGS